MADDTRTNHWGWKGSNDQDRSRRAEINDHDGAKDTPGVIYRKKTNDQRRRREKMKKRWSVRPDVNLVLVPRGKQCKILAAVILIFFGLFLAVAGLVLLIILKDISAVLWGVGIGMLVIGVVILIAGMLYMLCKCCFRTSTRYKQYKAQFKSGGKFEVTDASEQSTEMKGPLPRLTDERHQSGSSYRGYTSEQPSNMTSRTYVTANDQTLATPKSSTQPDSTTQWRTPMGYRPMEVTVLSDYTKGMETVNDPGIDYGVVNGTQGRDTSAQDQTEMDTLRDDFDKLEEALRELVMNKSGERERELTHLMREPVDHSTPVDHGRAINHRPVANQYVSTPINHRIPAHQYTDHHLHADQGVHTEQRVHQVPIMVERDPEVHSVPIVLVDGEHRATPPTNPIPPSYDQVLRNYRTYSRSASPTRLMESDL